MPHRPHEGPARPPRSRQRSRPADDRHALTHDQAAPPEVSPDGDYLSGPRIVPRTLAPGVGAADLVDGAFQAYNAGRVNEAARPDRA